MGSTESWSRKVVGMLKDAVSVGFAIMSYVGLVNTTPVINTRLADIEVAFIKVARHSGKPPKEKHLLILVGAMEQQRLRLYIKQVVEDRLSRTKNWMVAVKTLAFVHRLTRDVLPCIFDEEDQEKQKSSDKTPPLVRVSQSFKDSATPLTLQFSLWVRKYATFLVQRVQCNTKIYYATLAPYQNFEIPQLLQDFRSLHLLLGCLLDCSPEEEGPVAVNCLVHYALDLLVEDCPKICTAINDCVRKLLDYSFSDFSGDQALYFVYIYDQILQQYDNLSDFCNACTRVGLTDGHGDYLSQKRFLSEMKDRVQKYRHHCNDIEEETSQDAVEEGHITRKATVPKETSQDAVGEENITSKATAPKETSQDAVGEENITRKATAPKETSQDAVEEERPLINFGSENTGQEASYESNHAVKEWERAFDMKIKDSFTNYHGEIEWERALQSR